MKLGPLQRKWVKLLESGHYLQGKGHLCRINYTSRYPEGICAFCCLGLAADQVLKVKPEGQDELVGHGDVRQLTHYSYHLSGAWLSEKCRTKLGLTLHGQTKLAEMNDGGKMFKTIAKEIKSNPEKYFFESA